MKKYIALFILLLTVVAAQDVLFSQNDPWQPYELGRRPQPVVPEPPMYGAIMAGSVIAVVMFFKRKNKR